jgi:hypothetical protein
MVDLILVVIILGVVLWFARTVLSSFLMILAIFTLAWLLWYATGGVQRFEKSNQGIFIRPTNNYKGFETYGSFPEIPIGTSTQNN